jgi:class 3 adenylate cyclase
VDRTIVPGEHRLAARAVVCSGRVYVGDLGAKQRSNFTIIGPAVNETFRLEKVPDLYGLPLLVSASTAELILSCPSGAPSTGILATSVLVRVDDVELKGFDKPESVHALVPKDDPGLTDFLAGRKALDQRRYTEGVEHLQRIDRGILQQAAKIVAARQGIS